MALALFPGRFGREKWPGNFRDFKLPLPESCKTQSDFRSLSHDNSKPNCVIVETSQSRPFITIVDRSIALV